MDFSQFLQAIGAAGKLDVNSAVQAGGCTVRFDAQLEVVFEWQADAGRVQCFGTVLSLAAQAESSRLPLYAAALQLHAFGAATSGCFFALDAQADRLILFRTVELEALSNGAAETQVEALVNQLGVWQSRLAQVAQRLMQQQQTMHPPMPMDFKA